MQDGETKHFASAKKVALPSVPVLSRLKFTLFKSFSWDCFKTYGEQGSLGSAALLVTKTRGTETSLPEGEATKKTFEGLHSFLDLKSLSSRHC